MQTPRSRVCGPNALVRGLSTWLALCLLAAPTVARADAWTGPDKRKHAFYGAGVGVGAFELAAAFDAPPWLCAVSAAGSGLLLGLGKEAWDARGHGDPSARDVVWTVVPAIVVGGVLGWLHARQRARPAATSRPRWR